MSDTRQKKYGEAPAPRGPRPAARATERRSFHEESRNDRERGRRSEAPRRQYSSFTGEQAERPSRRQEEFSGWSRPGQREARAPRDARPSPWQMESELLPALPDVVRRELDALGQALRTVRPLRSAHYRNLPADIEALSRLLTCERSGLYRPYWSSPASTSAYLYYFLPWNVLRLARLFRSLPLPDPRLWLEKGQTPLLLDGGSGPLSVPLALWLARPEWRALPIQVLAVDNAVQPMELGRDVMAAWGDILGQPVWQVRVERGSLEHMPRLECKLADTLERQERHLRPWLLTAANVLNELSAESRQMNREDDEDEEGSGGVRRLENLLDELEPLCWPAPLNEDETGSADEALLPAALFVEPGTRLGGKTISRLRDAALERDLMPLAPCTHRAPCPLAHAHAGRGWCHFTFDCEGAPQWLQELSSAAGLAKSALSLAPLLLRADPTAGESLFDDLDDLDDDAPDNSREAAAMLRQPRPDVAVGAVGRHQLAADRQRAAAGDGADKKERRDLRRNADPFERRREQRAQILHRARRAEHIHRRQQRDERGEDMHQYVQPLLRAAGQRGVNVYPFPQCVAGGEAQQDRHDQLGKRHSFTPSRSARTASPRQAPRGQRAGRRSRRRAGYRTDRRCRARRAHRRRSSAAAEWTRS